MRKVLVISGSPKPRTESKTFTLANFILKTAGNASFKTQIIHVGDQVWSTAKPLYHANPLANDVPEDIQDFAKSVISADVVIIVSPIYHGSYSSQLKNLLDCLVEDAFKNKTIILASHGWGPTAVQPALHLQDVARTMFGNVYPRFITVNTASIDTEIRDDNAKSRIVDILQDL